jgi:leucyl-tRNA synthetase
MRKLPTRAQRARQSPGFRAALRQWMLRITAAMPSGCSATWNQVEWPEPIKLMQRNWIGRSTGADVDFPIARGGPDAPVIDGFDAWTAARSKQGFPGQPDDAIIRIYTTRPDTLFGATYMVLAPEHPLVARITTPERRDAVQAYVTRTQQRSESGSDGRHQGENRRVHRGVCAQPGQRRGNPRLGGGLRDDGLWHRGDHGRARAGPARLGFCKAFDLPIIRTVAPPADFDGEAYVGEGPAINSAFLDGLDIAEAKQKIIAHLEASGTGRGAVNYKLRDWVFTRQRYWGEPFPILHGPDGVDRAAGEAELPLTLPEVEDYQTERLARRGPPARTAAGPRDRMEDRRARRGDLRPRSQHHAAMGGFMLVLPALHRSARTANASATRTLNATGCRSTPTSAARNMRCCTCSTPASGTRCCSIWARQHRRTVS